MSRRLSRAVRAATPADRLPGSLTGSRILAAIGVDEAGLTPKLRRVLLSLAGEAEALHRQLDEARERVSRLEKLVDEDPLIPVYNRRAFVRELARMTAFAARYGVAGSLVYFDINNLKQINDAYGHAAGDKALIQVARILVESVRRTDIVGRLGGDEIGVLLVKTDKISSERKAAKLAALVEAQSVSWQGRKVPVSVAFGTYTFAGEENAMDVLQAADRAMYRRKSDAAPTPSRRRDAARFTR